MCGCYLGGKNKMDLDDSFLVDVGDKLIFEPQDGDELIVPSSLVPGQFETLYPDQPLIVSSISFFKETVDLESSKKQSDFLDVIYHYGEDVDSILGVKPPIDQVYFEFENVAMKLPMQSFQFPMIKQKSDFESLDEVLQIMENEDFNLDDYMDALVSENLYNLNLKEYVSLMEMGAHLAKPLTMDELKSQHDIMIAYLENQLDHEQIDEEDFERAADEDLDEKYLLQLNANKQLNTFYSRTGQFCNYIGEKYSFVNTYADLIKAIHTSKIKSNLMELFYDEEFLLKKEFLTFAMEGYPYIKKSVIERNKKSKG